MTAALLSLDRKKKGGDDVCHLHGITYYPPRTIPPDQGYVNPRSQFNDTCSPLILSITVPRQLDRAIRPDKPPHALALPAAPRRVQERRA